MLHQIPRSLTSCSINMGWVSFSLRGSPPNRDRQTIRSSSTRSTHFPPFRLHSTRASIFPLALPSLGEPLSLRIAQKKSRYDYLDHAVIVTMFDACTLTVYPARWKLTLSGSQSVERNRVAGSSDHGTSRSPESFQCMVRSRWNACDQRHGR